MRIIGIETALISVPLKRPFITALRRVDAVRDVLVRVRTEDMEGYGEAPPTAVITGDTLGSILCAIHDYIRPALLGMDLFDFPAVMEKLDAALVHNNSAKAAVDMALYDLMGKTQGQPLYRLLGNAHSQLETDLTLSLREPETMAEDARSAVAEGFASLKIKVGVDPAMDLARVRAVRQAAGADVALRVDANQGWNADSAIAAIRAMEDEGLNLELVEQPVPSWDFEGMAQVTRAVDTPILADESVFSPRDAQRLLDMGGCDLVNIKLMKACGIHGAVQIADLARSHGVEVLMGCMLESKVAVSAAAHFAAGCDVVTRCDLDGPSLCAADPYVGGPVFDGPRILMTEAPGLGISALPELDWE